MDVVNTHGSLMRYGSAGAAFSAEERERLILAHVPCVRHIARRIHKRLPKSVSLDDLVSTGVIGLISAIDRFNRMQKATLRTYAEYKIRGAILDGLRGLDWAPRRLRKRVKQIGAAISMAEQRLRRSPDEEEVAKELGLTIDQYRHWLIALNGLNLERLENQEVSTSHSVQSGELRVLFNVAISKLPNVERSVLHLYYYEQLRLREIAEILGVSDVRISQLKRQAILRLCSSFNTRSTSNEVAALKS